MTHVMGEAVLTVFSRTGHAWLLGGAGENVKDEPFVLALTRQAEGLLQLHLGGHSAGVTFTVHPPEGERVVLDRKSTRLNSSH